MGECEPCAPRERWGGGGARGKDLGSRASSLSDSALEACLRRALGPACAEWREGVLWSDPEREEGPPWVGFLLGPLFSLEDRSPQALAPTAPSPGSAGGEARQTGLSAQTLRPFMLQPGCSALPRQGRPSGVGGTVGQ